MHIFIDIIAEMYGIREIYTEVIKADGSKEKIKADFDFSAIDYDSLDIKVNIGSASYWSQVMQVQTMDSFFKNGVIDDAVMYLEHVPEGYITGKEELITELKKKKEETEHQTSTDSTNKMPLGNLKSKINGV